MSKDVHAEVHNQRLTLQTEKFPDDSQSELRHGFKLKQQEETKEEEEEQLLPAENLVPLSQNLIPPVLLNLFNLKEDEMQSDPATVATSALPEASIKPLTACSAGSASTEVEADDEGKNNSYGDGIGPSPSSAMQTSRMSSLLLDQADDAKSMETIAQSLQQQQHLSGCKRPMMNGFEYSIGEDDPSGLNGSYSGMMSMLNQQDKETSSNSGGAGSTGGGGGNSGDGANGGNSGASVRTLKRPRLVWTPQLHKRFVDAVTHLGIRNAVPKTIMQLMNVGGLTRENVASHLQKYRLYLRRVQQGNLLFPGTGNSKSIDPSLLVGSVSPTTDPLFAAAAAAVNVDSTSPSIRSNHNHNHSHSHSHGHGLHHNNNSAAAAHHILMPHHMNAALIFQQQQLSVNSPSSAVSPSPSAFHFTASSPSPHSKALPNSWPAPPSQLQLDHHHHQLSHRPLYHLENGKPPPPSPPKLALTLFPN